MNGFQVIQGGGSGRVRQAWACQAGDDTPCLFGQREDAEAQRDTDEKLVLVEYRIVRIEKLAEAAAHE